MLNTLRESSVINQNRSNTTGLHLVSGLYAKLCSPFRNS
jgi:hypothetical protein